MTATVAQAIATEDRMDNLLSPQTWNTPLGRVEAAVVGEGEPAVLVLHGTPGDWRQARALASDLASTATVVLVSRPGYGATPVRLGHTAADQAQLCVALLDVLSIRQVVVVGISGGGPSAFAFAAEHPDRCVGLVLCCAVAAHLSSVPGSMRRLALVPGVWRALTALARPVARRKLRDRAALALEMETSLTDAERRVLASDPRLRQDLFAFAADRIEVLRGQGLRNDVRQKMHAKASGPPVWPEGLLIPTVVLHGDEDQIVPLSHAQFHAEIIPGADLVVLRGFSHAVPVTARDQLAAAVLRLR